MAPWVTTEEPKGPQVIGDPASTQQYQVCGFCQARYLRSILQTQCRLCAEEKGREVYIETCEKCDPDCELHEELIRSHNEVFHGQAEDAP